MAKNDSHYNDVPLTFNSNNNAPTNANFDLPWTSVTQQTSDTSERTFTFPPITPPGGGMPIIPIPPTPPESNVQIPDWNWTTPTTLPSYQNQNYGQVRFLNASTNTFDVDITVDGNPYVLSSRFGDISSYDWISDGFHTITVRRSTSIRTILFQQNLPFSANQKVTMVLIDTAMGGLDMVRVVDTGCTNLPQTAGCYRFANMSYTGSSYDLLMSNGETVFRNIGFPNTSSYKQAVAGIYQFSVTTSSLQLTMRELPIILIGAIGTGTGTSETLLGFQVSIAPGRNYTTYIIGNNWSDYSLRSVTVED